MRVNVYSQELTDEVVRVVQEGRGKDGPATFTAARLFLHSSEHLHHEGEDDDRSAVTFWVPRSTENRHRMARAFDQIARIFQGRYDLTSDTSEKSSVDHGVNLLRSQLAVCGHIARSRTRLELRGAVDGTRPECMTDEAREVEKLANLMIESRESPNAQLAQVTSGEPHPQDLCAELRRAVGLFDGAMSRTPKDCWDEAIKCVLKLREDLEIERFRLVESNSSHTVHLDVDTSDAVRRIDELRERADAIPVAGELLSAPGPDPDNEALIAVTSALEQLAVAGCDEGTLRRAACSMVRAYRDARHELFSNTSAEVPDEPNEPDEPPCTKIVYLGNGPYSVSGSRIGVLYTIDGERVDWVSIATKLLVGEVRIVHCTDQEQYLAIAWAHRMDSANEDPAPHRQEFLNELAKRSRP